ncbi:MAG: Ig-like domain-containing protein [Pseudomonadota bacterium]
MTVRFNTSVSMTAEQHNGFTSFTNAPSQTVTISSGTANVTGDAFIENYVIGTSYLGDFTLGAANQNITGASGDANTIRIGSLTATGTIDGRTGTDTLVMGDGSSIAAATVIGMENLRLSNNASVTMTEAQHDAFAAGTVTASANEQITISAATDGFSALAQIETYVLGAANTVSLGAAAGNLTQSIAGSTGDDKLTFGNAAYTGTLNGGGGTSDTVVLNDGTDLSGATLSNFENLSMSDGATATLAAAQFGAFQGGTIAATGTQTLTVTGDGDFTTLAGIETYLIRDDTTNTRTITLGGDHAVVDADLPADIITFNVGTLTFTGLLAGRGLTDVVQLGNGADISSATLSSVENVTIDAGATVSMSEAQHDAFRTITATGTNGIVIASATDGFTTDETVESYTLGVANEVTLGTSAGHLSQDVTGSSGNDTLTLGAAAYTGSLDGAGGSGDTLVLVDGSDISGATVSAFENLTIAADATVTMNADQLAQFTGTITAPGAETVTVIGDGDFVTLANIETFNVTGDETDDARTITIAQADVDVAATATSDAVVFDTGALTYTGTITGEGSVNDTVLIHDGGDISGATLSNIEVLWLDDDASATVSAGQYAQIQNEAITANGTETLNIVGDGDVTLSGDTVETYTFGDDSTDARTVAISAPNSANISATEATDAITFALNGGSAFTGSFTADGTTANIVQIGATGASIAGGTLSGFTNLSTVGTLALTTSQANAFTGTITAAGAADTLAFASTGTLAGTNLGAIETFSTVSGGAETITLSAASADGKSLVAADAGSDAFVATGSAGAQAVTGSAGGDTLDGGAGNDTLAGGAGSDSLIGGVGDDAFRGSATDLNGDTISDLSVGDVIVLTGANLTDANVRFNGSNDALEIDTDATDFAAPEVTIGLSNAAGANLIQSVSNDGAGTTTISFVPADTSPVLNGLGGAAAYTEDGDAVTLDSDVTVSDAELDALDAGAGNYSGATLTLSRNGGADATDIFGSTGLLGELIEGQNLIYDGTILGTVTTNSAGTLLLTFSDASATPTTALVGSVMQSLTYANRSDTPDPSVVLNWVFNDGTSDSAVETVTVAVTASNDVPVLAGSPPGPTIDDTAVATPFTGLTYTDPEGDGGTITITYAAANGSLSGTGLSGSAGAYTLSGATEAELTSRLQALVFDPAENQAAPGSATTTEFVLTPNDGTEDGNAFTSADVTATSVNDVPDLGGFASGQAVDESATLSPFSGATIADPDTGQTLDTSVTLDDGAKGSFTAASLTASGFVDAGNGVYTLSGASAAATQAALRALVFDPSDNRVTPGSTETTTFTVQVDDGAAPPVSNDVTTVVSTAVNTAPAIAGTAGDQAITDKETVQPFAVVTITDSNIGQVFSATVTLDDAAKGTFTAASLTASGFADTGNGTWSITGLTSAAEVQQALRALVFAPVEDRIAPGADEAATLTLEVSDGTATTPDAETRITVSPVNDPAQIAGDTAGAIGEDADPNVVTGTLTATDPDGPDDRFVAVETPTATDAGLGSYTMSAGGDWVFTLDRAAAQRLAAGENVEDSFIVTAADGTPQTIRIDIEGANDSPRFTRPLSETFAADGSTVRLSLLDGARDPDGDPLTISDLSIVSDRRGEVRFSLTGDGTLLIDTSLFQNLSAGEEEVLTLSYALSDGARTIDAGRSIVIGGANRAPVAEDDQFLLSGSSGALIGNLFAQNGGASDRDPDGDPLRIVALAGTAVPAEGIVTVELSSGDTVDVAADGRFVLNPGASAGEDGRAVVFSYSIVDDTGLSDSATVTIDIAPDPTDASGGSWQFGTDDLQRDATIEDFTPGGSVEFDLPAGGIDNVQIMRSDTGFVIEIDTDDDGQPDGSISIESAVDGGGFLVSTRGAGPEARVVLDFAVEAPDLVETQALPDDAVNGITSTAYLTGEGDKAPVLTFEESTAALSSAIGTYVVAADGTIEDVRIIFGNTNATEEGARVALDPLGAGELLGLFLISGGAPLSDAATLAFVQDDGTTRANAFDDLAPTLLADGAEVSFDVFHAFSGLNENGDRMVWSGYDPETGGLTIGFEDLQLAASDRDYNDALIGLDFL